MLIEAAQISNLSIARYFAAWNVDFMSFQFDPSHPLFIPPSKALQIKNWLSGPQYGGIFNDHNLEEIKDIIELLNLHYVRFPFSRNEMAYEIPVNTIISCTIDEFNLMPSPLPEKIHGVDVVGDWRNLISLNNHNIFLNPTHVTSESIHEILQWAPNGLVLKGWNELETGLADFEDMDSVMEILNDSSL